MLYPMLNGRRLLCLILSLVIVEPIESESDVDTHTPLYRTLLKDYEKEILPFRTDGKPIDVHISYDGTVTGRFFEMHWEDSRLSWNGSVYENISSIRVNIQKLWVPDIVIYNSADPMQSVAEHDEMGAIVESTGQVYVFAVPVTLGHRGTQQISKTEWDLSITSEVTVQKHLCCPSGYPEFKVNITLQRKAGFYGYMLVSPAALLSLLTSIIFLIPPSSGERTTLGSVLLLCALSLLQLLDRHLPPQQVAPPILGLYYTCTMVFVSVALSLSAFIINIKTRGIRQNGVPAILRKIFLGPIKSLVFMASENFRPFNNMTPSATDPPRQMGDNPTALERQLGDLVRQLASINYIREREQIINNIVSDWHDLVLVLDRIFFVLFLCSNIIITMAFLM